MMEDGEAENKIICRFCFEGDSKDNDGLIAPCNCSGYSKYVHKTCLRTWQITILQSDSSHRRLHETRHLTCEVCGSQLRDVLIPSRNELLMNACGDAAKRLSNNCLLVSTRISSERTIPEVGHLLSLMLQLKLAHWKYGVYFVFEFTVDENGEGIIRALNLSRPMDGSRDKPIPDEVLHFQNEFFNNIQVTHFNGGPVLWSSHRSACLSMTSTYSEIVQHIKILHNLNINMIIKNEHEIFIIGKLVDVKEFVSIIFHHDSPLLNTTAIASSTTTTTTTTNTNTNAITAAGSPFSGVLPPQKLQMFTFSGYAQWTNTQLLGEIQRQSWNVIGADVAVGLVEIRSDIDRMELWESALAISCPAISQVH